MVALVRDSLFYMIDRPLVGVVTDNEQKWRAVSGALPEFTTLWARPLYNERALAKDLPHSFGRPFRVAEGKAERDLLESNGIVGGFVELTQWLVRHDLVHLFNQEGTAMIAAYSDTIRYLPDFDTIHEKPTSKQQWLEQVLLQSGRRVWSCTAYTLEIVNGHRQKVTFGVSTRTSTLPYTKGEVLELGRQYGIESLMETSGGLPLERAAHLFDRNQPLEVFFHESLDDRLGRQLLKLDRWGHLTRNDLVPFYTGAFAEVLRPAIARLQ